MLAHGRHDTRSIFFIVFHILSQCFIIVKLYKKSLLIKPDKAELAKDKVVIYYLGMITQFCLIPSYLAIRISGSALRLLDNA